VLGVSGYKTRTTAHFEIKYPGILLEANIDSVVGILESSYEMVTDSNALDGIGFSFEQKTWEWPIKGVVKELQPVFGALGTFTNDQPLINVNDFTLGQGLLSKVRMDLGKLILYYATETFDRDIINQAHFWLNLAVLTWSEKSFTSFPLSYEYPEDFLGHEMAPFNGMRAGATGIIEEFNHLRLWEEWSDKHLCRYLERVRPYRSLAQ